MGARAQRRSAVRRTGSADGLDPAAASDVPVVGPREPCPCGSGRRYKACHGRAAARAAGELVQRPFAGLPGECDWVALREVVPAATVPLRLPGEQAQREVTLATVLPMAWPALVRADGGVFLGLQVPGGGSGDPSRDAAAALLEALDADPGTPIPRPATAPDGPRLQDLLDLSAPFEVTVHDGFDFWIEGVAAEGSDLGEEVSASMERANAAVVPTARLVSVQAAYWAKLRDRASLRWVLPYDEEPALDAMARLHVAGEDRMGEGSRYIGSFRAQGLLVPVWDLAPGTVADDIEAVAASYGQKLAATLSEPRPLTDAERGAKSGLLSRQITLRQ